MYGVKYGNLCQPLDKDRKGLAQIWLQIWIPVGHTNILYTDIVGLAFLWKELWPKFCVYSSYREEPSQNHRIRACFWVTKTLKFIKLANVGAHDVVKCPSKPRESQNIE